MADPFSLVARTAHRRDVLEAAEAAYAAQAADGLCRWPVYVPGAERFCHNRASADGLCRRHWHPHRVELNRRLDIEHRERLERMKQKLVWLGVA